jgi:outer membrane protein assembly factor BamB
MEHSTLLRCLLRALLLAFVLQVSVTVSADEGDWPRFRGPNGSGVAEGVVFPAQWTERDYLWQKDLPGVGHSSPVVWQDQLYVTCGDPETAELTVLALDPATGDQRWSQQLASTPHRFHSANSYASSSPAVDERHVYLLVASPELIELVALTHHGKEVWRRELGSYRANHGFGVSPVVVDDMVVFVCDQLGASFVIALDSATGDTRWRIERQSGKAAYGTPCVWQAPDGSRQLILCSMAEGMVGVAPHDDGRLLWQLPDVFPQRCTNSPVTAAGLVMCSSGQGGNGESMVAVRPGDGAGVSAEVAFRWTKAMPQAVTPVAHEGLLFVWHDRGIVSCRDLQSGEQLWLERIGSSYYGSPICVGGRLYCMSADGEIVVLAAEREFNELGRVDLGEPSHATPAVSQGRMFLRTMSSLACLPAE